MQVKWHGRVPHTGGFTGTADRTSRPPPANTRQHARRANVYQGNNWLGTGGSTDSATQITISQNLATSFSNQQCGPASPSSPPMSPGVVGAHAPASWSYRRRHHGAALAAPGGQHGGTDADNRAVDPRQRRQQTRHGLDGAGGAGDQPTCGSTSRAVANNGNINGRVEPDRHAGGRQPTRWT